MIFKLTRTDNLIEIFLATKIFDIAIWWSTFSDRQCQSKSESPWGQDSAHMSIYINKVEMNLIAYSRDGKSRKKLMLAIWLGDLLSNISLASSSLPKSKQFFTDTIIEYILNTQYSFKTDNKLLTKS